MNQQQDHPYTAEDIRRYLQGEMPEAEMHALEKAALDDPMLADAIEGFQASLAAQGEMKTQQDVEELNRTFAERYHKTPVRKFPVWQVAAAAVVIIIAGVVTFNYLNKPAEQLAIHQKDTTTQSVPQKENVYQIPDTSVATDAVAGKTFSPAVASQQRTGKGSVNSNEKKKITTETADAVTLNRQDKKDELQEVVVSNRADSGTVTFPETAAPQANRELSADASRNVKQNNVLHMISGRVVNSNLEPLANAALTPSNTSVQPDNNNNRLNTDKAGYFNMASPDTSLIVKVTASGYREQLFRLRNNPAQNQLVLKPELKGKAAGISAAKKATGNATVSDVQNVVPVDGWTAFDNYIEKNKVYPAENSNLSGEVIVSFQVNNQGKTGNFKIIHSLAKSYDEEAIRLIKEGPKWKVLKGRRATVEITIHF